MATETKDMNWGVSSAAQVDSELGDVKSIVAENKADIGLKLLAENGTVEYTEEEARKVRGKIDLNLLPIVSYYISIYIVLILNHVVSFVSHSDSNTWTRSP